MAATAMLLFHISAVASSNYSRYIYNENWATSTCSGAFNTPCSIAIMHELVNRLADDLAAVSADAQQLETHLSSVEDGAYNRDSY